jgi:uncharacterized protein with PIN domain
METKTAYFRFYAELNDFLPENKRFNLFPLEFRNRQTTKHLIESLGVPHPEVDLILVNGEPQDFSYIVQDQDVVSVFPIFESFDISSENKLRTKPLREPKFVLDGHLGRLAAYMRLLGFDTLYRNDFDDEEIAQIAYEQDRICLTRDRGLLKRNLVKRGYCLRSLDSRQQVREVLHRFDLLSLVKPFLRCAHCNGLLEYVDKDEIIDQLEPKTKRYFNEFKRCAECGQVYWKGSHYDRIVNLMDDLLE